MKKVMWLMLVVVFAGISLQGQERKRRPEASRKPEHFRKAEVSRKPEYNREYEAKMKKEFHEMGIEKRELEFEAYISELEFENEMREIELERARLEIQEAEKNSSCNSSCGKWKGGKCRPGKVIGDIVFCLMFMMMIAVIHILLTIWVFIDTRKRDASGLWIVITFLTGFMGAFLYALVRIGDNQKK